MSDRNLKETLVDLCKEHHLLSAKVMIALLAEQKRSFNKTSVYRALDQLLADGTLCKHFFENNEALYELRAHHHAHMVCESCGSITQSHCEYHQPSEIDAFVVSHHHLTFFGSCGKCVLKQKNRQ